MIVRFVVIQLTGVVQYNLKPESISGLSRCSMSWGEQLGTYPAGMPRSVEKPGIRKNAKTRPHERTSPCVYIDLWLIFCKT
jgi:hypothetical protein